MTPVDRFMRWTAPILLFTTVFSVYMLTYNGLLTSADELSMVAVTENLVKRGKFDTDQLVWAVWEHGGKAQGTIGLDGHVYSKKGVGISILIWPLFKLGHSFAGLGNTHTVMLFNPLVCALTGVTLFAIARRWGYPDAVGFVLGLICGLATIIWPYSKTLFQEPATGLGLIAMVCLASGKLNARNTFAAGLVLALIITIKLTNAIAAPLVMLYIFYRLHLAGKLQNWRTIARLLLSLLSMPALAVIAMTYYNWLRFGAWSNAGYVGGETFSHPLLDGLSGLLFSSDESLFIFSPVLILAVVGIPLLWQRFKAEAVLLFTIIVANLCLFALWYDWRGGLAWGPRFTVPLTSLFMAMTLPLLHQWVFIRGGWRRWVFVIITLASVTVQGVASLVSYLETNKQWPVIAAFSMFDPSHLDTAWTQSGSQIEWHVIVLFSGIMGLSLFWGVVALRQSKASLAVGSIGLLTLTLFGGILSISRIFVDHRLAGGDDYRALASRLVQVTNQNDTIIVDNHIYTEFFLNYDSSLAQRYGFLRSDILRPEAETTLEKLLCSTRDIWLISDRPVYSSLPKPEETWLNQHTFRVGEEAFSDYARLIRYYQPAPGLLKTHPASWVFDNGIRLVEYQLAEKETWSPGEMVGLVLFWQVDNFSSAKIAASIQLLRPDGTLSWQYDSNLHPGQAGDQTINRYSIPLPDNIAPGEYQLLVVLYDPTSGQRAEVVTPDGSAGQSAVVLKSLTIQ